MMATIWTGPRRPAVPGNGQAWSFAVSEGGLNTETREISRFGEIMRSSISDGGSAEADWPPVAVSHSRGVSSTARPSECGILVWYGFRE